MNNPQVSDPAPPPQLLEAMAKFRIADNKGALDILEPALLRASDPAPLLALAGLAALRLGEPARAIPHLQKLLVINPGDVAARANLANAFIETGQPARALEIVRGSTDAKLARIEGYVYQGEGKLVLAEKAYRRAVESDSNDLSSWNNLGNILSELGRLDEAVKAFERAISIAPADAPIYRNLANVLIRAERPEARLKTLKDAEKIAPNDPSVLTDLGLAYAANDDLDRAIETLQRAINRSPGFCDAHIEQGMIFESLNRVDDLSALIESVDRTTAPPEFAFLLAWQAQRDGRFDDAARHALEIPETVHAMRRFHLIGSIADRRGDAETAFVAFQRMNEEAIAATPPANGEPFRTVVESDIASWTDDWAARWLDVSPNDDYRDPVFLVGFPRSGTTLLDTMLMGSPELSVLEERPMMARTVKLMGDVDLPTLSAERIGVLRNAYFKSAAEYGWDRNRWLVDKHPLNMERVPAIHRLFPNARFIMAERHPCDVVLSCFMANFQLNLAMRSFTSLDETARTYDAVFRAWHRGKDLFPIASRAVRYERLVEDAQAELAPLIDWLGLQWHSDLLDHQLSAQKRGRVRTASYSQIGEKLYTRATDRWRRYAGYLAPVLPILRPWAERMGYDMD